MSEKAELAKNISEDDFIKKFVLEGFSLQENALKNSTKQFCDDKKEYVEALKRYEEVTSTLLIEKEYRHRNLVAGIDAKTRIKSSYDDHLLHLHITKVQDDIMDLCEEEEKDFAKFTTSVNGITDQFGCLDPAFEETLLIDRIHECKRNIEDIRKNIGLLERVRQADNNFFIRKVDSSMLRNLKSEVNHQRSKMIAFINENREAVVLIQRNIGFLKQKIAEKKKIMNQL